jgi:penicillin-binding protein 1C
MIEKLPTHNPKCEYFTGKAPIVITYPQDDIKIWIPKDFDGKYEKVIFQAAHQQKDALIYWYLDNKLLGTSRKKHSMVALPENGVHELVLVDSMGNRASNTFSSERF